jgi:hypothetical protein
MKPGHIFRYGRLLQSEENTNNFFCDSVILMNFYGKCDPMAGSMQLYHCMQSKKINMNIRTCYTSINVYSAEFMYKLRELQVRDLQSEGPSNTEKETNKCLPATCQEKMVNTIETSH